MFMTHRSGFVNIIGNPNVGKSTLFNKLIGRRLSIVKDTPGVTRDRIMADCEWAGRPFLLTDTGGIEPKSDDVILSQMKFQAQVAIEDADVIIFLYRDEYYKEAGSDSVAPDTEQNIAEIIVAKNRHGPTDTVKMVWDADHTLFMGLEKIRNDM